MNTEQFWSLIEGARKSAHGEEEGFLLAVRKELSALAPAEIASFQERLEELLDAAYSWELWGAGYIMNGGCSEDMFEYFRAWLIAQGRATYEAAMNDPETLAKSRLEYGEDGNYQLESLLYLALSVYEEKAGKEMARGKRARKEEPSGEEWSEDGDDLEQRWPRLWKRFEELWG